MLRNMLTIFILPAFVLPGGCAVNPVTGEKQLMLVGEDWERQVGRQYSGEVEKQLGGRIENRQLQNYINNVGQKIAAVSHRPGLEFHYTALNHESINAMALPGGYVFITRGMLERLTSEAQLAGVLAHETAHITARHSAAAVSRQMGIDLALSVAGQKVSSSAMDIARVGAGLIGLRYSREQETQADMYGLDYMVKAGYNPYAMVETIEMLQRQNKMRPIEFFSSHPDPANRKANILEHISSNIYPPTLTTGESDYAKFVLANLND